MKRGFYRSIRRKFFVSIFVLSFFNERRHSRKVNIRHATGRKTLTYLDLFFLFLFLLLSFFLLFFLRAFFDANAKLFLSNAGGSGRGRTHEWNISIISRFVILDSYDIYVVFSITIGKIMHASRAKHFTREIRISFLKKLEKNFSLRSINLNLIWDQSKRLESYICKN